ncbi:hypothetical protein Q7A53_05885 [Halobacillus rhizosphaerae]|uniref:hypothetical protein n=1 Tax=Halobacillus rhizosphaerae TaxID=3064889 RepID=UPI00398AC017
MVEVNFENVTNMNEWSENDLEKAKKYYQETLLKTYDDNERLWYIHNITKCQMMLDELNNNEPEWLKLFK